MHLLNLAASELRDSLSRDAQFELAVTTWTISHACSGLTDKQKLLFLRLLHINIEIDLLVMRVNDRKETHEGSE